MATMNIQVQCPVLLWVQLQCLMIDVSIIFPSLFRSRRLKLRKFVKMASLDIKIMK